MNAKTCKRLRREADRLSPAGQPLRRYVQHPETRRIRLQGCWRATYRELKRAAK